MKDEEQGARGLMPARAPELHEHRVSIKKGRQGRKQRFYSTITWYEQERNPAKGVYLNSGDLLLNFWLSIGSFLCHQLITESWPSVSQQLGFLRSFCLTMFTKVITHSKKGGTTPYCSKLNNPYLCFSFFCFSALRKVPWDAKRFRDKEKCPSCQIWHMKAIQLPPWWLPPLSRANKPSNWSPKKEWLSPR